MSELEDFWSPQQEWVGRGSGEFPLDDPTPSLRLVGLCGYAGAGKDALAALLRMRGWARVAFADGVREEVGEYLSKEWFQQIHYEFPPGMRNLLTGIPVEEIWAKPTSARMRKVLQSWGSEFRRAQDPDYWVKSAMRKIDIVGEQRVVVSDVRFPNEVRAIRARGGEIWKIIRPGLESDGHISEENIKRVNPDREIINSGTLLDLAEKVLPWVD